MIDLTSMCRGWGLRLLTSLGGHDEEVNGFEAWRLLDAHATDGDSQKGPGMLTHIMELNSREGFYCGRLTECLTMVRRDEGNAGLGRARPGQHPQSHGAEAGPGVPQESAHAEGRHHQDLAADAFLHRGLLQCPGSVRWRPKKNMSSNDMEAGAFTRGEGKG